MSREWVMNRIKARVMLKVKEKVMRREERDVYACTNGCGMSKRGA